MAGKQHTWEEYDQGRQRQGSSGSQGSARIQFSDATTAREQSGLLEPVTQAQRDRSISGTRRRSSFGTTMNSLAQVGGPNSIENFARSWQRAAGFHEIAPARGSFALANEEDLLDDHRLLHDEERTLKPRRSLLRHQVNAEDIAPESAIQDSHRDSSDDLHDPTLPLLGRSPSRGVFASPFSSSFTGATYGSFPSREGLEQRQQATKAFITQAEGNPDGPEKDREPLLIQQIEEPDGKISIQVIGQSTIYQTIFNSSNTLIGVGILSLPLGIRYAGWLLGSILMVLAAVTTSYTARLLGRCLDVDRSMITYSDIALFAYGKTAELGIGLIFVFELLTANIALVVLFGDSLHLLIPSVRVVEFELLAGLISLPLAFAPLRVLSITSICGILSCCSIAVLVIVAGLAKPDSPGSLVDPAVTYLLPEHWTTIPLSLGLIMSPWGGHAVFPQFYRDMRHPQKFGKAVATSFSITFVIDASIAVTGLLMFGDKTRAEITSNIFETTGYPRAVSLILVVCISIIPLTKLPLNAQPIFSVVDNIVGLREVPRAEGNAEPRGSKLGRKVLYVGVRLGVMTLITIVAIICPGFDSLMSIMGSLFCMSICVCLPAMFYLKLYGHEIGFMERIGLWTIFVVGLAMAIVGTTWAFLPAEITRSHG